MTQSYHSHGKFLLTGEYLVLKGALALALPLKLGQSFEVETLDSNENRLQWHAHQPNGPWFSVTLNPETLDIIDCDDQPKAEKLAQILKAVKTLNPKVFEGNDLRFTTHLDFDPNWGFGSSSTLIANLARWANVNPYELLKLTFGGSGYDIACATAEGPIYYQLTTSEPALRPFDRLRDLQGPQGAKVVEPVETPTPIVEPINSQPSFANHLFFVS